MPRNRTFSQYVNARIGAARLDTGARNMLPPGQAVIELATRIAGWNRYVARQSHPSWQGQFISVTDSVKVTVNVTLPDGTTAQFDTKLGTIRRGTDINLALQRIMSGADIRNNDGRRIRKSEIEFCLFRFRIDDGQMYI